MRRLLVTCFPATALDADYIGPHLLHPCPHCGIIDPTMLSMLPVSSVLHAGVAAAADVSVLSCLPGPLFQGPVARTKLQRFLVRH